MENDNQKLLSDKIRGKPLSELNINKDELYHSGILGMKWGIRRYQNKDGSLTAEGKARYAYDTRGKKKGDKGYYEPSKSNPYKWVSEDYNDESKVYNQTGNIAKNASYTVSTLPNGRRTRLDTSNMSNKDIQDAINRYNLERQYNEIFSEPTKMEKGKKAATQALTTIGAVAVTAGSVAALVSTVYDIKDKQNAKHSDENSEELYHYGVKGMKKGERRWTNEDGTLTEEGKIHYGIKGDKVKAKSRNDDLKYKYKMEKLKAKTKLQMQKEKNRREVEALKNNNKTDLEIRKSDNNVQNQITKSEEAKVSKQENTKRFIAGFATIAVTSLIAYKISTANRERVKGTQTEGVMSKLDAIMDQLKGQAKEVVGDAASKAGESAAEKVMNKVEENKKNKKSSKKKESEEKASETQKPKEESTDTKANDDNKKALKDQKEYRDVITRKAEEDWEKQNKPIKEKTQKRREEYEKDLETKKQNDSKKKLNDSKENNAKADEIIKNIIESSNNRKVSEIKPKENNEPKKRSFFSKLNVVNNYINKPLNELNSFSRYPKDFEDVKIKNSKKVIKN